MLSRSTSLSAAEAEYVSMSGARQEVLWLGSFQEELLGKPDVTLYCDNKSTFCIALNGGFQPRTKHIDVRHHFVKDCFRDKKCSLLYLETEKNVNDVVNDGIWWNT